MGDRWKDNDNTVWQGGLRSPESTEAGSLNQTGLGQGSRYMLKGTHKSCPNARIRVTHMQKQEGEAWSWRHLYKKVTESQADLRILFRPSQPPSCHNTHKNVKMLIWHLRIWGCLQVNRYIGRSSRQFRDAWNSGASWLLPFWKNQYAHCKGSEWMMEFGQRSGEINKYVLAYTSIRYFHLR